MKILWLNWRDIKNPEAGGAEVFTHSVYGLAFSVGAALVLSRASETRYHSS